MLAGFRSEVDLFISVQATDLTLRANTYTRDDTAIEIHMCTYFGAKCNLLRPSQIS